MDQEEKNDLLISLLGIFVRVLDINKLKIFLDAGLDAIEDMVEKSKTPLDDLIILPLCKQIRAVFQIEDND